jgi:hypothetical protein
MVGISPSYAANVAAIKQIIVNRIEFAALPDAQVAENADITVCLVVKKAKHLPVTQLTELLETF